MILAKQTAVDIRPLLAIPALDRISAAISYVREHGVPLLGLSTPADTPSDDKVVLKELAHIFDHNPEECIMAVGEDASMVRKTLAELIAR